MAEYKQVKNLTPVQSAYIAGLVDGEGTITLTRKHRSENRRLALTVSSTERKLLEYVLEVVGAGIITNKRVYRSHHRASWTYQIFNRQALDLLRQIASHLNTYKANRAALVLKQYILLTPRNGKYSVEMKEKREAFVQNFFEVLPEIKVEGNPQVL